MFRQHIEKHSTISRRHFFYACYGFMAFSTALASCSTKKNGARVVRLGYQTSGDLAHEKGVIEKRLTPQRVGVQWTQFISGPPLLEALNVGSIDLGPMGETPPIFAQAAGTNLVYLVNMPASSGEGEAIIVPKDSPIRTMADLKGKKVAYAKVADLLYQLKIVPKQVDIRLATLTHEQYVAITPDVVKREKTDSMPLS